MNAMKSLIVALIVCALFAIAYGQNEFDYFDTDDTDDIDDGENLFDDGADGRITGMPEEKQPTPFLSLSDDSLPDTIAEGSEFLKKFAAMKGVIQHESGVMYRVLRENANTDGESPTIDSLCKIHYRGFLVDGTEFDSSRKRGEPSIFFVSQLVRGWGETLTFMREGDFWEVVIPAKLAYGSRETKDIPGNSVLVFEIELLEIEPEVGITMFIQKILKKQIPGVPFRLQIWQAFAIIVYMGVRYLSKAYFAPVYPTDPSPPLDAPGLKKDTKKSK